MATKNKTTARPKNTGTKSAGAKTAAKKRKKPNAAPDTGRISEVAGIILIGVGVLAGYLVWLAGDATSTALIALRTALLGTAGTISSILPIMLCGMGVIMLFVGRKRVRMARALLILAEALLFCGVWHLFSAQRIESSMLTASYREFIKASYREGTTTCAGAGALGAFSSWHLYQALDVWGAAIVLIVVMLIIALLLSRTSMREVGERITETISGGMDEYRERRQVRGREKAEMRAQSLERRVAREEQERLRRDERQRAMEQARIEREDAENRINELQRRRRQMTVPDAPELPVDAQPDSGAAAGAIPVRQMPDADMHGAPPDDALPDMPPDERRAPDDVRNTGLPPVAEDSLESMKSRHRGDQEAYNQAMREHMMQEGVPMFLDKRVPGRIMSASKLPPVKGANMTGAGLGEPGRMVFEGYDDHVDDGSMAKPTYGADGFARSPAPEARSEVVDFSGLNVQPGTTAVEEILNKPQPQPQQLSESELMRPLRASRIYDGYERGGDAARPQPFDDEIAADMSRAAHGSAAMKRIAGSRMVYEAATAQERAAAPEPQPDDERAYARAEEAQIPDTPVQPETPPQTVRTGRQLPPLPGTQTRIPADARRVAFTPAPGSAYAVGMDYEDGMPFERYNDPAAMSGSEFAGIHSARAGAAPVMQPSDRIPQNFGIQPVYNGRISAQPEPAAPQDYAAQPAAQPQHVMQPPVDTAPQSAPDVNVYAPQPVQPIPMDDDMQPAAPAMQAQPVDMPQDMAEPFEDYTIDNNVNADMGAQPAANAVNTAPGVNQKVAMYTPSGNTLDRGYNGTRPDGTPIKMPAPAMEEVVEDKPYFYPPIDLLEFSHSDGISPEEQRELDAQKAVKLEETLQSFGIQAQVVGVSRGPAITRFELSPAPGVRVSKIAGLADDIALNLAATTVRIEAPIPGKAAVGIELPNEKREMVTLRDVLDSPDAAKAQSKLAVALGKDNAGKLIIADIAKMPHVLIAGATGSGKSVCINTIIMSIIYRATPDEVRLILVDPKVVELSVYNGVPHLLVPVVTDPKKAASALNWAVLEMTERYQKFAKRGVRDIKGFNHNLEQGEKPLPQIVVIIDELADLMMVAPGEVEDAICRLAQLARAAGIHLVIATQRPSVNVITGVIKANIPSRIAFTVASQVDSRTILDGAGAEKLLGRGDMLFFPQGVSKPQRVQGANVTDEEVNAVTTFIKSQHEAVYNPDIIEQMEKTDQPAEEKTEQPDDSDPLLVQAISTAVELGQVSISMLQRKMRIGYARAGRIVDEMTQRGIIGEADGAKPRPVLMSRDEFKRMYGDAPDAPV